MSYVALRESICDNIHSIVQQPILGLTLNLNTHYNFNLAISVLLKSINIELRTTWADKYGKNEWVDYRPPNYRFCCCDFAFDPMIMIHKIYIYIKDVFTNQKVIFGHDARIPNNTWRHTQRDMTENLPLQCSCGW